MDGNSPVNSRFPVLGFVTVIGYVTPHWGRECLLYKKGSKSMATMAQRTYMAKSGEIQHRWWLVDASGKVVGRLASDIAMYLMGKHRPEYTPHVDTGDYVVVINAEKVIFTGKKWSQKQYTWFTGYTGLRVETAEQRREKHPELILKEAVRRMLPKNKLGRKMLDKLKIYVGSEHPHQAQKPEPIELGVK